MLICDVDPLNILPLAGSSLIGHWRILVFEFVLFIGLPCNTTVIDSDIYVEYIWLASQIVGPYFVAVVEETLGDETAWDGRFVGDCIERNTGHGFVDSSRQQILVIDNGIARRLNLLYSSCVSHELLVVSRFNIAAVILIEIIELVVNENVSGEIGI